MGGALVWSDVNGNYDHWLPVGTYTVTLALADGQGTPAQDVLNVPVLADVATVQHLNFRGQQSPAAPTAAAAKPAAVQPAVATPTAVAENAPAIAGGAPAVQPKRLPVTSESGSAAWLWLTFGVALLLAGGMVGFGPVLGGRSPALVLRTHAANSALLRTLLTAPVQAARPASPRAAQASDDLLAALLTMDTRRAGLNSDNAPIVGEARAVDGRAYDGIRSVPALACVSFTPPPPPQPRRAQR